MKYLITILFFVSSFVIAQTNSPPIHLDFDNAKNIAIKCISEHAQQKKITIHATDIAKLAFLTVDTMELFTDKLSKDMYPADFTDCKGQTWLNISNKIL